MSRIENPNLKQRNFPPSALAYDEGLRAKLADAIMVTVKDGCTTNDTVYLALHEIRDALTDVLSYFVGIEPDPRHQRLIRSATERLRRHVAHHRRSGARERLYRRAASVVDVDRNSGGHA